MQYCKGTSCVVMKTISHILCALCFSFWRILTCCDPTCSLSPVDFKLEIPDPGGKDDVWAFGSPGVGFGLLGVWCTRQGMAGHGRAWQGMAGHGRAWQGMAGHGRAGSRPRLSKCCWMPESDQRRWCNHLFNLVILSYTKYILYMYIYIYYEYCNMI